MAGYIGTQAVSVNTTSATISDDLAVGDDATVAGDATVTGVITGSTVEATGDTAAGDNAAMGYTAAEGLILTGQGSTNDVTIKNDADADVIEIPTGTVNVTMAGLVTLPQLAITHDSNADTVTLTRTANDDNNILKFVTGSTSDWIVGERNDSSSDFRFYSYGTSGNVLSIARSNGAVTMAQGLTLTDGDLAVADGHGISFALTGDGGVSTPSELFDDYEEGTWTPVLKFGGSSTGIAQASTTGRYTKVGRMVYASFNILLSDKGSQTGAATISGLPFAHFVNNNLAANRLIFESNGASANQIGGYAMPWNDSKLYLRFQAAATYGEYTHANFTDTTKLFAMVTYESPS